jgi:hypothetical protein
MPTVALIRSHDLPHHVAQGVMWIENSGGGANTVALSYAAFEFRLAIERLALQLWAELSTGIGEEIDFSDIRSFKRIEKRIYELGGHQKEINRHFEFMADLLTLLKIPATLVTPDIGKLSRYWHDCSELCHVGWSLACGDPKVVLSAVEALVEIRDFLLAQMRGWVTWPMARDEEFRKLRDSFVSGQANADHLRAYLEKVGVWARVEFKDGRPPQFVGEAIPPSKTPES